MIPVTILLAFFHQEELPTLQIGEEMISRSDLTKAIVQMVPRLNRFTSFQGFLVQFLMLDCLIHLVLPSCFLAKLQRTIY